MTDAAGAVHPVSARTAGNGRPGLPPLRPGYQQQALAAIVDGFATTDRGTVVAACGTGKTVLSGHAAVRLVDHGLVVMACPSLPLIAQTLREFTRFGLAADAMAVCSDDTVADAAVTVSDLPCPVTTDPQQVADWLRSGRSGRRLLLVTHLSSGVAGQGLRVANTVADLLIVDEAHRTAGWVGKRAGVLHRDDGLPARRRLYLTATPRVFAGGRGSADENVLSMDDVATFGPRLFTYPFAAAIRDGWLDDYRLAVVGVSEQEAFAALRQLGDTGSVSEQDRLVRTAVVQTALARAAAEFGLRRIMVFCPWIKDSRHFAETLQARVGLLPEQLRPKGRLTSIHVDSTQSNKSRQAALELLAEPPEQGWTVLSNARCLSEGIDVPAVDGVVFTAPKSSPVEIVQSVGRALRRNPKGSGIATILVPVLLPNDDSWGEQDWGTWNTVCQVVRALRAHDDEFAAALDRQRTKCRPDEANRRPSSPNRPDGGDDEPALPPQVVIRLPDSHQVHDLLRHITVRVLEGSSSEWWAGYGVLTRFYQEHGHVRVPWRHVQDGIDLSQWINKRRGEYQRNKLAPDRVQALERLGLQWTPAADGGQRLLDAATAFHADHGHLRVPRYDKELEPLYAWLVRCRRAYHAGSLDPQTAERLTRMGMDWQKKHLDFDGYYALAQQFHKEHGHLDVPKGYVIDGADLHHWILRQRMAAKRNQLGEPQRQALDRLGMVWDGRGTVWATRYAAAAAFREREGHLSPPVRHREGGVILSKWLGDQRRLARAGRLPPDRYAALARIGLFPAAGPAPASPTTEEADA